MLDEQEIQERVRELAGEITRDFSGDSLHTVGVLNGCYMFLADLTRAIELDMTVDFLGLSSYGNQTETSGEVRLTQDLSMPIENRHVLIVEDIVDTGLTMQYLLNNLRTRRPASISVCTLLDKPANRRADIKLDYVGFTIPDKFVIGYGLDFAQFHRNIPYIGVLVDHESEDEESAD